MEVGILYQLHSEVLTFGSGPLGIGKLLISIRWYCENFGNLLNTIVVIANLCTSFFVKGSHTVDRVGGLIFSNYIVGHFDHKDLVFGGSGISSI